MGDERDTAQRKSGGDVGRRAASGRAKTEKSDGETTRRLRKREQMERESDPRNLPLPATDAVLANCNRVKLLFLPALNKGPKVNHTVQLSHQVTIFRVLQSSADAN